MKEINLRLKGIAMILFGIFQGIMSLIIWFTTDMVVIQECVSYSAAAFSVIGLYMTFAKVHEK